MRRVLAFYKFIPVTDPEARVEELQQLGEQLGVVGTILLAEEGVNGTIVAETDSLDAMARALEQAFGAMTFKYSDLDQSGIGFHRFKVCIKREIVSFGVAGLDLQKTGEHVDGARWNELLADPEVLVIDTRNHYEIDIGTFENAVSPDTDNFREFPQWIEDNIDPTKQRKVAMFCTGGIRCEKASALVAQHGVEEVYQLNGGILQYLEDTPAEQSRWQGECFVFDQRVSVNHDLNQGQYRQCYACRHPLSKDDMQAPEFEHGVSCPFCHSSVSDVRRQQFRERQRQVRLAAARGEAHIGVTQRKDKGS
ncbi:MAG: hypothetical protein CMP86_03720 [Gammaproteobacteria bacterium]|nr:hypothetical protein [Gammaproteobacteria bacterium]